MGHLIGARAALTYQPKLKREGECEPRRWRPAEQELAEPVGEPA